MKDRKELANHPITTLSGVINLVGVTNFSELCLVVKNASVVIANDSGIMHVADAIGAPLVAMYGPTDQTRTRPLARTSKIISTENESFCACYGFKAGEDELLHKYGPNFCMQDITPSKVLSVITKVLN